MCPASVLQLHPHATVVVDEAAAAELAARRLLPRRVRRQAVVAAAVSAEPAVGELVRAGRRARGRCGCGSSTPGRTAIEAGFELTFTTVVQLDPAAAGRARRPDVGLPRRRPARRLRPGAGRRRGSSTPTCGHRPGHANDGPASAYLDRRRRLDPRRCAPAPRRVVHVRRRRGADLPRRPAPTRGVGAPSPARDRRLHPDAAPVLSTDRRARRAPRHRRRRSGRTSTSSAPTCTSPPARDVALQRAFTALVGAPARRAARRPRHTPRPRVARAAHRPRPAVLPRRRRRLADRRRRVARPQPVASAPDRRRGWRVPDRRLPGAHRRRRVARPRLPIPPLLGSGSEPYGGCLRAATRSRAGCARADDGRHRRRARGRPARALLRRPRRRARARRPATTRSGAVSVQFFVDNVLNPGVAGDAAVPRGRVRRARRPVPVAVAARRRRRGARPARGRARRRRSATPPTRRRGRTPSGERSSATSSSSSCRRPAGRSACGRRPPSRARCDPDDGYVVGWKSAADCRRLAAAGYDVVASPAEVYYLDMAADTDWYAPGTSWAGHAVARRRRGVRRHRRLDGGGAGEPARHPGVPLDRARPRPPHARTAAVPPPGGDRRSAWTAT